MPKSAVKDALQRAVRWIAMGKEGVTLLSECRCKRKFVLVRFWLHGYHVLITIGGKSDAYSPIIRKTA